VPRECQADEEAERTERARVLVAVEVCVGLAPAARWAEPAPIAERARLDASGVLL